MRSLIHALTRAPTGARTHALLAAGLACALFATTAARADQLDDIKKKGEVTARACGPRA